MEAGSKLLVDWMKGAYLSVTMREDQHWQGTRYSRQHSISLVFNRLREGPRARQPATRIMCTFQMDIPYQKFRVWARLHHVTSKIARKLGNREEAAKLYLTRVLNLERAHQTNTWAPFSKSQSIMKYYLAQRRNIREDETRSHPDKRKGLWRILRNCRKYHQNISHPRLQFSETRIAYHVVTLSIL